MRDSGIVILNGNEAISLLEGRELEIIETVRRAYEAHARGESMLPHSTFLRFPHDERNRIIALPAYLGEGFSVAGMKWIASFPANPASGSDRASAVIVLNSTATGRPEAIIEGSVISAKRTAASAALAARSLSGAGAARIGLIGCGLINFEIARFLLASWPEIESFLIFDTDPERAGRFKDKFHELSDEITVRLTRNAGAILRDCSLISLATTATVPHIPDLSSCPPRSTILHISLRDLTPEALLSGDNVVDDIDHVCRAQTSVHLAERLTGTRDFIRCTLADVLLDRAPARRAAPATTIFSPFGLGILDLAVAQCLLSRAREQGVGTALTSFFPDSWLERNTGKIHRRT